MNADKTTTRKQLQGYGASHYLAYSLTKNLTSVTKQGRAYAYVPRDVIVSIREYKKRPRIKPTTSQTLEIILRSLLERLGNITEVPFTRGTDPEMSEIAKQLIQAMSDTDSVLAELKATAATIKAKYIN